LRSIQLEPTEDFLSLADLGAENQGGVNLARDPPVVMLSLP
jgi:hypothetical protein